MARYWRKNVLRCEIRRQQKNTSETLLVRSVDNFEGFDVSMWSKQTYHAAAFRLLEPLMTAVQHRTGAFSQAQTTSKLISFKHQYRQQAVYTQYSQRGQQAPTFKPRHADAATKKSCGLQASVLPLLGQAHSPLHQPQKCLQPQRDDLYWRPP